MNRLNKIIADSFIEDLKKQDKKMINGVNLTIEFFNTLIQIHKNFQDTCNKRNKIKRVSILNISKGNLLKF